MRVTVVRASETVQCSEVNSTLLDRNRNKVRAVSVVCGADNLGVRREVANRGLLLHRILGVWNDLTSCGLVVKQKILAITYALLTSYSGHVFDYTNNLS